MIVTDKQILKDKIATELDELTKDIDSEIAAIPANKETKELVREVVGRFYDHFSAIVHMLIDEA